MGDLGMLQRNLSEKIETIKTRMKVIQSRADPFLDAVRDSTTPTRLPVTCPNQ